MKNEASLHFLGWMILSNVTEHEILRGVCAAMALGYACIGVYETISGWGKRK